MTLVKFNRRPYERSLNTWVDGFFNDLPSFFNNDVTPGEWKGSLPPVNIHQSEKAYHLEVVAPGFEKADFKVSVDQNLLTISAEKKVEAKDDSEKNSKENQIRREYNFRSFKRSFTIDENVDATNIGASYVNGVLTLNLPKKEKVKELATEIKIK